MPNYDRDGNYDIDLASSGAGWLGTFAATVSATAIDILSDGEAFGPVAITTGPDGEPANTTITGTLTAADTNTLTVIDDTDPRKVHAIPAHTVLRFQA